MIITLQELLDRPEIRAAAHWWAHVALTLHSIPVGSDNPESYLMKAMTKPVNPLTPDQRIVFEEALVEAIAAHIDARAPFNTEKDPGFGSGLRVIGCDYGPDAVLTAAGTKAHIWDIYDRLPWKTQMWVNYGEVTVSSGRGGPQERIYPV